MTKSLSFIFYFYIAIFEFKSLFLENLFHRIILSILSYEIDIYVNNIKYDFKFNFVVNIFRCLYFKIKPVVIFLIVPYQKQLMLYHIVILIKYYNFNKLIISRLLSKDIIYIRITKLKIQFMTPPQKHSLWWMQRVQNNTYILHLII